MSSELSEKVREGVAVCWGCGRTVKGALVFHKDTLMCHLVYECPVHGQREHKLCKGKPDFPKAAKQEIPSYWPVLETTAERVWDDTNITNRQNIPVLVFSVTSDCNASCKICDIPALRHDPPSRLDPNFLKMKLACYSNKEVILCGGEPTMREDLPQLIDIVRKSGNVPSVHTNGLRLADRNYVKMLKRNGVRHVYLSFDGFSEETYEKIRGNRRELGIKLRALENLVRENFMISLTTVVLKGLNDDAIGEIIDYARRTRNIAEITFLPFSLTDAALLNGFGPEHMLSEDEIRGRVATAAGIPVEYFALWDEFKMRLALYIAKMKKIFSFLPAPVFRNNIIYLKRTAGGLGPSISEAKLREAAAVLKGGGVLKPVVVLAPVIARMIFKGSLMFIRRESRLFYRENIFKITVFSPLSTSLFGTNSLTAFGFYDSNIGAYNSLHQR